ncbi:serine hydrolase [Mucilaginibacter sp. BT774]|uniref:serine hydrolase domain-containing protein n=1 Tax=Mucilaginibacter sp. BT774 TaxID=3062276 RepID=UPI002674D242|nr:serine hydrolase domain-containing protein [Mucilaginibacter sp. BT774]MDO3627769.1 serine hydrolase domain-containing protein [Mucilaginibacter sp. BT774]
MRYLFGLIFLIIATGSALAQSSHRIKKINPDTLVSRLGTAYMKAPQSVGLSIGLFYNGKDYSYNFGSIEKGKRILPSDQTVYAIGSISKTFISLILAHAVLEKKVNLDDDIRKYLKGNYQNLEYQGRPIRLKDLASTTSALPENLLIIPEANPGTPPDSIKILRRKIFSLYNRQAFFDALHQVKLDTIPGTKARHNNTAIQLLSFILENVYQIPYSELVKNYVLKPLGMNRTTYQSPGSLSGLAAHGYDKKGNAIPFFSSPTLSGSGGLTSTTKDMLKFIHLQLNPKDSAIQLSHEKLVSPDVYSIGLNWLIYKYDDGYSQIWTDGGTYGFCSYIILYPELNTGIVLLSNENDETSYGKLSGLADGIFNAIKQ